MELKMKTKAMIGGASIVVLAAALAAPAQAEMTVSVGGRIQADYVYYDEDNFDLGSGTEFRRTRLFASGNIADDWKYKAQYDFAGNGTDIKDMYVQYTGWDLGKITLGQHKQEAGLEVLTSSKYITFIERAAMSAFVPDRRISAGLSGDSGTFHYAASIFGDEEGSDGTDTESLGFNGRLTWAPKFGDNNQLHFGASASWQDPGSDSWRVRARPETHKTGERLVNTETLGDVDDVVTYGFEGAWVGGPFSLQGEWMQQTVNRDVGDEPDLSGFYVYGSWFITGESRSYKKGKFGRTKASNAWEIALRYSNLDLEDGEITGGEQDIITFGVNYYVNPYLRFMLNYVATDADDVTTELTGDGPRVNDEPNAVAFRVAMDFK
jgi:phosphate-selective porin OprO/OprP